MLGPLALADQYARLRSSVSHSGTSRGPVSDRRAAMPSTLATTPESSFAPRAPLREPLDGALDRVEGGHALGALGWP